MGLFLISVIYTFGLPFSIYSVSINPITVTTGIKVLSHRRRAITRCVNAINEKNRTLYILMILSHCTRNAASCVQCERIIKIYMVLIFPLIALMLRVIARRL